jgi:hypothetical protein
MEQLRFEIALATETIFSETGAYALAKYPQLTPRKTVSNPARTHISPGLLIIKDESFHAQAGPRIMRKLMLPRSAQPSTVTIRDENHIGETVI